VSVFLLVFLVVELGGLYQYLIVDNDHPTMVAVLEVGLVSVALAGLLNRLGRVAFAGALLVAVADLLPLAGVHATSFGGRLDVLHLGTFYLLAGSEIVAASVLAPWSVFPVALANSALADATIALMPHTPALASVLASNNAQQVYAGPLVMQLIVALVAYLWARSTLLALQRADRAEELTALEQRELERTRELEEGVHQLLAIHVQLANGNFAVRAPAVRNPLLWQIGNSLNNLIGRLARLAQADYVLRRTHEESHQLAEAIRLRRGGHPANLPAPSGTPLDAVIVALTEGAGRPAAPSLSQTMPARGSTPVGPASVKESRLPSEQNGHANGWPEWLER
jgi:hypothetical protein